MENSPTTITVVAAALEGPDGRFLMQRRPLAKQHGGLWEFPGGKVEAGETARDALVRELNEELGIGVDPLDLVEAGEAESASADGRARIVILLYRIRRWQGQPVAEADASIAWYDLADATRLPMPPLDVALLAQLREHGG